MPTETLLSNITKIEHWPRDPIAFQKALEEGETMVMVRLNDNTLVDATKPICIQREDGRQVYLKIPNPCNHKPQIAYTEAAVAQLARELLLRWGVYVPEYEIIELTLDSPLEGVTKTPCCLVEALEAFESFGACGDDINVDPSKIKLDRLSEESRNIRLRQSNILFSKEFAAFSAVMQFIANNDPHQENFGLAAIHGQPSFAAIDFDMAPMPFLIEQAFFGPYNAAEYTKENNYHCEEGGRHTPNDIDLSLFPVSPKKTKLDSTPDRWVTTWCSGFNAGLDASPTKAEFQATINQVFYELANLSDLFFVVTFKKVITPKILETKPELTTLQTKLIQYFKDYTRQLNRVITTQLESKVDFVERTQFNQPNTEDTDIPPFQNSSSFFRPSNALQKQGGSPEMDHVWGNPE